MVGIFRKTFDFIITYFGKGLGGLLILLSLPFVFLAAILFATTGSFTALFATAGLALLLSPFLLVSFLVVLFFSAMAILLFKLPKTTQLFVLYALVAFSGWLLAKFGNFAALG